jgi:hypothetical protein
VTKADSFVPAAGAYFVLPIGHYGPADDLPFDFWSEVNWHIRESGMTFDNDGVNRTKAGGAIVLAHLHYWLMQVQPGEPPFGIYTLRAVYRQVMKRLKRLKRGLARFRELVDEMTSDR